MKSFSASMQTVLGTALGAAMLTGVAHADPREHELNLPIGGEPGPLNAIIDRQGAKMLW